MGRRDKPVSNSDDALAILGARLRAERQKKGIRLTDLAKELGYTKGHLSAIEHGTGRASRELVEAYERHLRQREPIQVAQRVPQEIVLGRRNSPVTKGMSGLLRAKTQEPKVDDASATLKEIENLLNSIIHDDKISPQSLRLLVGFLKAGLAWLRNQDEG